MSTAITRMAAKPRRSCHAKLVCSQSAAHSAALTGSVQASRLARTQAHPKQNECLPHILQHCGGRAVGVADGCEVGILAGHQSTDGEEHEPQRVAPVRPDGPKLRAVPYERAAEQHHAGQKHPHHGQPSAVHALTGEEILSHRAGRAPAHAAERRAQKAAQRPLFFVHTRPPAIIFAHCSRPCAAFQAPCASLHIFAPRGA